MPVLIGPSMHILPWGDARLISGACIFTSVNLSSLLCRWGCVHACYRDDMLPASVGFSKPCSLGSINLAMQPVRKRVTEWLTFLFLLDFCNTGLNNHWVHDKHYHYCWDAPYSRRWLSGSPDCIVGIVFIVWRTYIFSFSSVFLAGFCFTCGFCCGEFLLQK